MDEIGVPFAETTDYDSLEDDTVKIREKGQQRAGRTRIRQIGEWLRKWFGIK